MAVISGTANKPLAQKIVEALGTELLPVETYRFKDGETGIRIKESVRGYEVFVIQPTSPPVNENLMELLIMLDALRRASVAEITVIMPYYGYARQDRKSKPREPITARLVAELIEAAGADRVVAVDLHVPQIQGFFKIPVDNLTAMPLFADYARDALPFLQNAVVASPDVGGVVRANGLAYRLDNRPLVICDKRRTGTNVAEIVHVIGDVADKDVLIVDDIIDTGGSLMKAAKVFKERGAKNIWAFATHGLFSEGAVEAMEESVLERIVVTDTVRSEYSSEKIQVVSVAPLIAEAIRRIRTNQSISALFD
ncbi:ribose-phosphate diphosphokinase [Coprothermobacter platensis]|uniref:ribose-phosphate diphosphokinase n=1 Tax=Coprothermobacter platensis TaxID=108819 RepID=UPI000688CEE2